MRANLVAFAFVVLLPMAALVGCGLLGDAPVENGITALRQACELAGAPDGDLDVCAELLKREAARVAE